MVRFFLTLVVLVASSGSVLGGPGKIESVDPIGDTYPIFEIEDLEIQKSQAESLDSETPETEPQTAPAEPPTEPRKAPTGDMLGAFALFMMAGVLITSLIMWREIVAMRKQDVAS